MAAVLEIMVQGDGAVTSHSFRESETVTVGRSSSNSLHLEHAAVSRKHGCFILENEGWVLEDLGSSHGTWLNGRRVQDGERPRIGPGDVVQIRPWSLIVRKARNELHSSGVVEIPLMPRLMATSSEARNALTSLGNGISYTLPTCVAIM